MCSTYSILWFARRSAQGILHIHVHFVAMRVASMWVKNLRRKVFPLKNCATSEIHLIQLEILFNRNWKGFKSLAEIIQFMFNAHVRRVHPWTPHNTHSKLFIESFIKLSMNVWAEWVDCLNIRTVIRFNDEEAQTKPTSSTDSIMIHVLFGFISSQTLPFIVWSPHEYSIYLPFLLRVCSTHWPDDLHRKFSLKIFCASETWAMASGCDSRQSVTVTCDGASDTATVHKYSNASKMRAATVPLSTSRAHLGILWTIRFVVGPSSNTCAYLASVKCQMPDGSLRRFIFILWQRWHFRSDVAKRALSPAYVSCSSVVEMWRRRDGDKVPKKMHFLCDIFLGGLKSGVVAVYLSNERHHRPFGSRRLIEGSLDSASAFKRCMYAVCARASECMWLK